MDYIGGPYTVTFTPGANNIACFLIRILLDSEVEDSESFDIIINLPTDDNPSVQPGFINITTITIAGTKSGNVIYKLLQSFTSCEVN